MVVTAVRAVVGFLHCFEAVIVCWQSLNVMVLI